MAQSTFLGSNLLDDRPVADWHGLRSRLQEMAANIARLAPELPAGSPLLISGDWGSGKTSLLLAIKSQLHGSSVPVVWFDAWRYEQEATLLAALIRAVWEQSCKPDALKEAVFNPLWRSALVVGLRFAPELASLLGLGFLNPLLKLLDPDGTKKALDAVPRLETVVPPENENQKLQQRFKELLEKGWPERSEKERVVILIDDLDRCSPTGMVSLLEGIRLLLVDSGETPCSFVVALDKTVLAQAVAQHYAGISGFDSFRYLEKVFPIHLALPTPDPQEVGSLVAQFLTADPTGDHRDALAGVLRDPLFANPRLMKRCINRFRLAVEFETRAAETDPSSRSIPAPDSRALARWIAATERWSPLRELLLKRPEQYWDLVGHCIREPGALPPDKEAKDLLDEPGSRSWLLKEMLGKHSRVNELREADQRLRRWGL